MLEILFPAFAVLVLLGIPIAAALGTSSLLAIILASNVSLLILPQKILNGINGFPFMAIPLFLFAGNIMSETKISNKLVNLASVIVGRFPGGLAHVATAASAMFGAISGSAPATTAAIGSLMIPSMVERGYKPSYSAAVVASAGGLGLIIPPSLTMVIYGVLSGASIGSLFLCGIIPGALIALALIALNYYIAKKNNFVESGSRERQRLLPALRQSVWALLMPLLIMGGIYSGAFTPTESAAVACGYGLLVGFTIYRNLTFGSLYTILKSTVESTGLIMFLMGTANLFSYVITAEQVPQAVEKFILGFTDNPKVVMFLFLIIFLIVGTFLENAAALVLLIPPFMNVVTSLGIDPVYFGVFTVIALGVGTFTPPVGLNLFIAANIAKVKMEPISYQAIPYVAVYVAMLILFIFMPSLLLILK
ncbi:MAG: TRAP transporter large permease [Planctomycetaceae bacterium]|nr:TRAP transporter large permease [Planctomycetaceae bacterium]